MFVPWPLSLIEIGVTIVEIWTWLSNNISKEKGSQLLRPSSCRVMLENISTFLSFFKIIQHLKIKHNLFAICIITLITKRPIPSRRTVACKHVHQVRTIGHVLAGITLTFIDLWSRNMVSDYPNWLNIYPVPCLSQSITSKLHSSMYINK